MAQVALDNLSVLEIITRGGPLATEPSPAAKAYFGQKIAAARENPTAHSAFFNNAFIPWMNIFDAPREFDSYTDKIATRRMELGVTRVAVDAHDVPGSVQNNPNDPQNELRFERYRPNYRQYMLYQNRDEFTPITIDTNEILRLMIEGGPDGTNVSNFVGSQVTMAVNRDRSAEFHTLMMAIGLTAGRPNLYHVQIPDLLAGNATSDDALKVAARIRAAVKGLQDFVPFFTPARNNTTVPKDQVRLVVRQTWMEALGTLGYSNSFNPEYVFALPENQIIDLPDHYFDRQPGLADKVAFLVDAGTDQKSGSLVVVDTFHNWGVDVYGIKGTENRALHHSSILGTNDFRTFITIGVNVGTQIITPQIVPSTISGVVYGASGDIANGGNLTRGQEYSTRGAVLDASGFPAGGHLVEITSTGHTPQTYVGLYNEVKIGLDDLAQQIKLKFSSIVDPDVFVERTYNLTGTAQAVNGSGALIDSTSPVFSAGSGSGGTITYTLATGEIAEISTNNGASWATAGASPIAVPSGQSRRFRKRASSGYVYPTGAIVKNYGPWTAA